MTFKDGPVTGRFMHLTDMEKTNFAIIILRDFWKNADFWDGIFFGFWILVDKVLTGKPSAHSLKHMISCFLMTIKSQNND